MIAQRLLASLLVALPAVAWAGDLVYSVIGNPMFAEVRRKGGGTYQVWRVDPPNPGDAEVRQPGVDRAQPQGRLILNVSGPGELALRVFPDVPLFGPKPREVVVEVSVDGQKPLQQWIRVRTNRELAYTTLVTAEVGQAAELLVPLGPGPHRLKIGLREDATIGAAIELVNGLFQPALDESGELAPMVRAPDPSSLRSIEAFQPREETPREEEAAASESTDVAPPSGLVRIAALIGATLPRSGLSVAPAYALEASIRVRGLFADQLRVGLSGGYALLTRKGPRVVPGRGFDPAAIQNTDLVPLQLYAAWDLPIDLGGPSAYAGAAVTLLLSRAQLVVFSARSSAGDASVGVSLFAGIGLPAGPGRALIQLAHAEGGADYGPLGASAGETTLSGTTVSGGYALEF